MTRLSAVQRRIKKTADIQQEHHLVMFSNSHLHELKPDSWHDQVLGQGASGTVYRATWRGVDVAIKETTLPTLGKGKHNARAREVLKQKVQKITENYIREVELCVDLAHPNLVRLMGYATKPQLLLIQELMHGGSLEHQLYDEAWRPSPYEVMKVALDVAEGMEYLHTTFELPVIHRDLKSPNLLLASPPCPTREIHVKITDFGLSKDKDVGRVQTDLMTGCGSTLWMAPEIC